MSNLKQGTVIELTNGKSAVVKSELGRGGQGVVYKVECDGKEMALKWYHNPPSINFYQNLQRNVDNGAPSTAFIWPKYVTKYPKYDSYGYVMDLRPGQYKEFGQFLLAKAKFKTFDAMLAAAMRICEGFQKLHLYGYSYQDLNDGNFFIDPDNGDVLICDNDNVMSQGENAGILGKARYMAPEIVTGSAMPDKYSDRFSLSVLLFLLLFGSHPLEGSKVIACPCLTEKSEREFYGHHPVFIYDQADKSNRPAAGVHVNVIRRWPIFPSSVKNAFIREFSQEKMKNKTSRCIESDWRKIIEQARDSLVVCPHCKCDTFSESGKCVNCRASLDLSNVIRIGARQLELTVGTKLYIDNDNIADATVVLKDGKMWIKNLSSEKWHVETLSGRINVVESAGCMPVRPGLKISFGTGIKGVIEIR